MAKIGIDVDGVLTYLEEYQLKTGKKYFKTQDFDETKYDIQDIFNVTKKEREKYWTKYIWNYCLTEPIRVDAKKVIDKLKEDGHEIHIITGRVHTTKDNAKGKLFRKMLVYWLKKNGIQYDSINYCSESNSASEKFEICKKLGIDIMIEDKKENIDAISEIANVICINTSYNQDVEESKKVIKTTTLWDAYKKIRQIVDKNCFIPLSKEEKEKLSIEEKNHYFDELKNYYENLPYDEEESKKLESNYVKCLKVGLPLFKLAYKPMVINKENVPKENGVIYVSNHLGSLDQFPIMTAIGNSPTHYLAASTLLPLKRGLLYRKTGCIFVDRNDTNSRCDSKEKLAQYVLKGSNVFMFPEGTRNRTEKFMLDFKLGAVSLAQQTGAKIVPFAVNNNYKIGGDNLMVRVGKPIEVKVTDDLVQKNEELRDTIATMIWYNMELEQEIKCRQKVKKK